MEILDLIYNDSIPIWDKVISIYEHLSKEKRKHNTYIVSQAGDVLVFLMQEHIYENMNILTRTTLIKIMELLDDNHLNMITPYISDVELICSLIAYRNIEFYNVRDDIKNEIGFFNIYLKNSSKDVLVEKSIRTLCNESKNIYIQLIYSFNNNNEQFISRLSNYCIENNIETNPYFENKENKNFFMDKIQGVYFPKINRFDDRLFNFKLGNMLSYENMSKLKELSYIIPEQVIKFLKLNQYDSLVQHLNIELKKELSYKILPVDNFYNTIETNNVIDNFRTQYTFFKENFKKISETSYNNDLDTIKKFNYKESNTLIIKTSIYPELNTLEKTPTSYKKLYSEYVKSTNFMVVKMAIDNITEDNLMGFLINSHLYSDLRFLYKIKDKKLVYDFLMNIKLENHKISFNYLLNTKELHTVELFSKLKNNIYYNKNQTVYDTPIYSDSFKLTNDLINALDMKRI